MTALQLPLAVMTIRFTGTPTGSQILGLTQQSLGVEPAELVMDWMFYDGRRYSPGQSCSTDVRRNVRLVPDLHMPFFDPNGNYGQALLIAFNWPHVAPLTHTRPSAEYAVLAEGPRLQSHFDQAGSNPSRYPAFNAAWLIREEPHELRQADDHVTLHTDQVTFRHPVR